MELRTLQYFLTVAREGTVSRAAEVLHLTQPTLSRQIAQLEAELGCRLFDRDRQMALTEQGVLLERRARELLQLADKTRAELADDPVVRGSIALGSGGLAAAAPVAEALSAFCSRNPEVTFRIYTNAADHLQAHLDQGDLDFALLLEPVDTARYDFVRLPEPEVWGLLMRAGHPLAARPGLTYADLRGAPLLVPERLPLQRELTAWASAPLEGLDVLGQFNLIDNAAHFVETFDACVLTIAGSVRAFDPARYAFVPLTPPLTTGSVLAWKKSVPLSRACAGFLAQLREGLENSTGVDDRHKM